MGKDAAPSTNAKVERSSAEAPSGAIEPSGGEASAIEEGRSLQWRRLSFAVVALATVAAIAIWGVLLLDGYRQHVAGLICVYILVVTGLSFLFGYTGQLSVGQAGFVAIGAYTTAIVALQTPVSPWLAILFGGILASLVGFVVGLPVLRMSVLYIAAVTFGFGEIVRLIALHWKEVTRGGDGLALPLASTGSLVVPLVLVTVAMVGLAYAIVSSPVGRAMKAVRDSEVAARAIGVRASQVKTLTFAMSGFYAGVAGGFFALLTAHVSPDSFTLSQSLFYLTAVVVGGLGTVAGPVVGAIGLGVLHEVTRGTGVYRDIITGAVLLGVLLTMPQGVAGLWQQATARLWKRGA